MDTQAQNYVDWFRNSAPYINANRGKTLVLYMGGEAVASDNFEAIVHDIALLQSLGVKLVIVHGAMPQIDAELSQEGQLNNRHKGRQITPLETLQSVKEAVSACRVDIEAALSMGLANSPMHGAKLRVVGGNFITAKPLGIVDGVDYGHAGNLRRLDTQGIKSQLDQGAIVLISPLGYSPSGEVFNLEATGLAAEISVALNADKIIFMGPEPGVMDGEGQLIQELNTSEAEELLATDNLDDISKFLLENACKACNQGVDRAHLVGFNEDGALLNELYTRDGAGTLITVKSYEQLRQAEITDVGGIIELIRPLEKQGILVRRSRELLEQEIDHFCVIERDNTIIACAALYPLGDSNSGELACVAVHPDYHHQERGDKLLEHIVSQAKGQGLQTLFVLTTQSAHWFQERGFHSVDIDQLPEQKKSLYNFQRNSKALELKLS